jgi:hypothetical protein
MAEYMCCLYIVFIYLLKWQLCVKKLHHMKLNDGSKINCFGGRKRERSKDMKTVKE